MDNFKTPGVYIKEIPTLPASIAGVETAIPAFIGYTEKGDSFSATRISSLLEYEEIFGGPNNETIAVSIADTLDASNTLAGRLISATLASPSDYRLYYQVQMYYNNGGGPCFILSVGSYSDAVSAGDDTSGLIRGINTLETVDEPTLLVFPDAPSLGSVTLYGNIISASLAHCAKMQDRFTISDVWGSDMTAFRQAVGSDNMKYGAAYYPALKTVLNYGYDEETLTVASHTENGGAADAARSVQGDTLAELSASNPSLYRAIVAEIRKLYADLSPCGAIAGVYARVDKDRGVWKAPANVGLRSVIGPTIKITNEAQESLNVDASTGKSINVIRSFTGKGTLVWGARTLAGNDNEWRYVPVRRLYIYIEESVKKATEFVVFEPNDANTWLRVKTMIENFLTTLWRDGALAGAKTDDAFFVRVGLGETMTYQDILEGRMNVEIGMAAVRPAEFIILKFSHKIQES